jgi:DhnA family fructose-bisphosphate aldolase class Ia
MPSPDVDFERLRRLRAEEPALIGELLKGRQRRELLQGDRRLFIVAADHPARGALAAGARATAMADRYDLLSRLVAALARPGVDGVLGTPDIIEDLAVLGALDGKVVVGSMNRGGLSGSVFEMDDRYTGYDVPTMVRDGIDFAKLLVRINLADRSTADTLYATAAAVSASADARLPIMLEPFMSEWVDGRIRNDLSTEAVVKSVAIASGLGASSAYSWLKLPVVPRMDEVMAATSLPTLLLGGDPGTAPEETLGSWADALLLPGVRGLVAGRTLLYPEDDDVEGVVDTAAGLVHASSTIPN